MFTADRPTALAYLRHVADSGASPQDLIKGAVASEVLAPGYADRFLPCPVFLEPGERARLAADLLVIHDLLVDVPNRFFGGDRAALARAIGLSEVQTALVCRAPAEPWPRIARADLYRGAGGFQLLEHNITSALGGFENAHINRTMLAHPALAGFVQRHGLTYVDTLRSMVDTMLYACGDRAGVGRGTVAIVDSPQTFPTFGPRLRIMAELLGDMGIDAVACHFGEFTERGGHLELNGRRIDVVFRFFLVEEIESVAHAELVEPVIRAAERGTVGLFAPLDAELYGNKGSLAMLSDCPDRESLTAEERSYLDRFLPWTRYVRPHTTVADGASVDLLEYAAARREELILKPTALHGGAGIVAGWTVSAQEWDTVLANAVNGPFVLQQRVRPVAEPNLGLDGTRADVYLNWGVFYLDPAAVGTDGYGGCIVRGSTDSGAGVVSMSGGASVGCCFQPEPDPRRR